MKRSVALRFSGMAVAALVQAVSYVVLARMLGAAGFGQFAAVFALGTLLYVLTGFGFTPLALRSGVVAGAERISATVVCTRLAATVVIVTILGVSAVAVGASAEVAVLAVAFIAVDAITDICQACLAGARRIGRATLLLVLQRGAVLAAIATAAIIDAATPVAVVALIVVGANLALTVRARPELSGLVGLIASSRGYWAANLAASISQLEVPVITATGGAALGGLYAAGARAASPVNLAAQAILQVATPDLTAADREQRTALFRGLRRATWWLMGAGAVCALPIGLLAVWVLGAEYEAAWASVAGFVVGGTIMGANQAHQALLLAAGLPGRAARSVAFGASVGVVAAGVLAFTVGLPWLGIVPVLTQGTMYLLFRRAVADLLSEGGGSEGGGGEPTHQASGPR